ncbi:MAG: hypothetical protein K2N47_02130, partial [Clostridia bacterium]|nr:hypothetical protein [Clostridia bacterium]
IGGAIFALVIAAAITLIVFHIVAWVGGESAENFRSGLEGVFHIQWVYDNNPLMYIVHKIIPQ